MASQDVSEIYRTSAVDRSHSGARGGSSRKGTRRVKDAACPICGFKTIPPHDGRAHRSQSPKKPFTADELAARGFRKA